MRRSKIELFLGVISIIIAMGMINTKDEPETLNSKYGILLVTFGSTYPTPQQTFKTIDRAAHTTFENADIRWAYTSDFIIKRLREGKGKGDLQGKKIDNNTPTEALEEMRMQGHSTIAVQSLHIIPGDEFDDLVEDIKAFEEAHEKVSITIGHPLLDTEADIVAVANILADKFKADVEKGPVCFMGHGTRHASDDRYLRLDKELKKLNPKFYVGTVEGIAFDANISSIGAIIKDISTTFPKTEIVTITPLMSIAGDHTNNDMNAITGEENLEEQSWRERLMGAGYTVSSVMKGLGDYEEINAIWMAHLEASKSE